jgi:hypothetical protein
VCVCEEPIARCQWVRVSIVSGCPGGCEGPIVAHTHTHTHARTRARTHTHTHGEAASVKVFGAIDQTPPRLILTAQVCTTVNNSQQQSWEATFLSSATPYQHTHTHAKHT